MSACVPRNRGMGRRAATMTKREGTPAINLGNGSDTPGWAALDRAAAGTLFSIGFARWPDAQLICHTDQFSQRFGFHLQHHPSPVNFDGFFGSAKIGASLFVE